MSSDKKTKEKLETYKRVGINRISFGLQSTKNEELKILGRIHTYDQFLKTYEMARNAGFPNINIDLMSALPGQTEESWKKTLTKIAMLKPSHISAYSLIIEEGTPLFDKKGNLVGISLHANMNYFTGSEKILSFVDKID